jgi:hypothetical protein
MLGKALSLASQVQFSMLLFQANGMTWTAQVTSYARITMAHHTKLTNTSGAWQDTGILPTPAWCSGHSSFKETFKCTIVVCVQVISSFCFVYMYLKINKICNKFKKKVKLNTVTGPSRLNLCRVDCITNHHCRLFSCSLWDEGWAMVAPLSPLLDWT